MNLVRAAQCAYMTLYGDQQRDPSGNPPQSYSTFLSINKQIKTMIMMMMMMNGCCLSQLFQRLGVDRLRVYSDDGVFAGSVWLSRCSYPYQVDVYHS